MSDIKRTQRGWARKGAYRPPSLDDHDLILRLYNAPTEEIIVISDSDSDDANISSSPFFNRKRKPTSLNKINTMEPPDKKLRTEQPYDESVDNMSSSQDLFGNPLHAPEIVYSPNSPILMLTQTKVRINNLDWSQETSDFKAIFEAATPPRIIAESPLSTSTYSFSRRLWSFDMHDKEDIIELSNV
ncbi:hypothetical protein ElyMa_001739200 [Elysia marginata]|uniref:Uncharacterized protein n=1 Tax=Elysia marginata TaxID=1093978 RepID=A0AAV4JXT0_9GAST|nr:hypothetical protein ElyMa_001739200 [Elysia marginata]